MVENIGEECNILKDSAGHESRLNVSLIPAFTLRKDENASQNMNCKHV